MTTITGERYTLYHGDCLEVMPALAEVDVVITDPPYGIDFKSNGQIFLNSSPIVGDKNTDIALRVIAALRPIPTAVFFSPYAHLQVKFRSVLVWEKGQHVGGGGDIATCWKRDFEMIGVLDNKKLNGNRDSSILKYAALLPPPTGHFAEKPIALMEYLINKLSAPGDTILDPFMGSGTTGVAAMRTGRRFIGIELDAGYFQIAAERIANAAGDLTTTARERASGQMSLLDWRA